MKLTPKLLKATYEALICTAPLDKWNLPPTDRIIFSVVKTKEWYGWVEPKKEFDGKYDFKISDAAVKNIITFIYTMYHEIIHILQYEKGLPPHHNAKFRHCRDMISKHTGLDPKNI